MSDLKEYIVTLHNREDLDDFYDDMETPGGNLYIPDRAVDLHLRRAISRNTHYMLTEEEAQQVKNDSRVWDVEEEGLFENEPFGYEIDDADFNKNATTTASHINWGLLRHTQDSVAADWGNGGGEDPSQIQDVTITSSGKNVDVLVVDGMVDDHHPELQVNPDGTGGQRVVQFNWFGLNAQLGRGANGVYQYEPYTIDTGSSQEIYDYNRGNNHGAHVAGTIAGNTLGWARKANIYNINPFSSTSGNPNGSPSGMWDYIREWHNTKPINPETGIRNPTISNHSYGISRRYNNGGFGPIVRIRYRGVEVEDLNGLTNNQLAANGMKGPNSSNNPVMQIYSTHTHADIQDAIADGIIVITSAGNDGQRIVAPGDVDYDNMYWFESLPSGNIVGPYLMSRGSHVGALPETINTGALAAASDDRKTSFSTTGSRIDVFAAGDNVQSATYAGSGGGPVLDTRSAGGDRVYTFGKKDGTSMAGPQVAGVAALLMEHYPRMTQAEVKQWIVDNSIKDEMHDTEVMDDNTDVQSLQNAPNRILKWNNQRPTSGATFPRKESKTRPTSGVVYPRVDIRRS